jgi:hypothetical protein
LYGEVIEVHLRLGKVNDGILQFAEEAKVDLIVMGTTGAFGLKENLSGSKTQIVARKSEIPVLSLTCDRSDLKIENLLLVHDFNKPEKLDLYLMNKLIDAFGYTLHMLQITSRNPEAEMIAFEENIKLFAMLNSFQKYVPHLVKDIDVENGVVHFNQMNSMNIICIGTHCKGSRLHKSATEKLINHFFKPIISFHLN